MSNEPVDYIQEIDLTNLDLKVGDVVYVEFDVEAYRQFVSRKKLTDKT